MPTIAPDKLARFATSLLEAGGVPAQEAQTVAKSLIVANLMGHDSHGIMRVPYYLDGVAKGEVKVGRGVDDFEGDAVAGASRRQLGFRPNASSAINGTLDCQSARKRRGAGNDDPFGPHWSAGRILRASGGGRDGGDADGQHAWQCATRRAAGGHSAAVGNESDCDRCAASRWPTSNGFWHQCHGRREGAA